MKPRVYLAGPIKGLQYGESVSWRTAVSAALADSGIESYSPMRGKEYLDNGSIVGDFYPETDLLASPRSIFTRDYRDCTNADLVIAYLSGARAVSIGTMFELAWTNAVRRPLVVVDDYSTETHRHPFVTEAADWIVSDLEQAMYVARSVLLP